MRRLLAVILTLATCAFAPVQPLVLAETARHPTCGCCDGDGSCGMPDCLPPPVTTRTAPVAVQTVRITVAEARTTRSWPHTITIDVRPRVAALVLKNPEGQLEVVDATGVKFGAVETAPSGIPVVTAESAEGAERDALKAALSLVRALPRDLSDQVGTITVSSANLVTFTIGEVAVTWGGADEPQRKVEILRALLKTGPTEVDVSAPDTPTTR